MSATSLIANRVGRPHGSLPPGRGRVGEGGRTGGGRVRISLTLDRLVRPEIRLGRHVWPAYRVAVYSGVLLGVALAGALAARLQLSPVWLVATAACGVLLAVALGLATKLLVGGERYTVYHYQLLVLGGGAGLLALCGLPVLPYLDLIAVALAVTQGCGRLGCLMAGCCHGRPHAWGVCYGSRHVAAGFPRWLAGVRLFPVQALESLGLFAVAAVGGALALTGARPGEILAWYVVAYALGRFALEPLRGDAHRPEIGGLSEAQWIALLSLAGISLLEAGGLLPAHPWHRGAFAVVAAAAMICLTRSRRPPRDPLASPRHLEALGEVLERAWENAGERSLLPRLSPVRSEVHVEATALGLRVSAGRVVHAGGAAEHYTFSRQGAPLSDQGAQAVARWILKLRHPGASGEVIRGGGGIFHLLVQREAAG